MEKDGWNTYTEKNRGNTYMEKDIWNTHMEKDGGNTRGRIFTNAIVSISLSTLQILIIILYKHLYFLKSPVSIHM